MGYFTMLAAIPGFFLSSFFFMLLWGVIAPKLGWQETNLVPSQQLVLIRQIRTRWQLTADRR